jgi:hypothetical protein
LYGFLQNELRNLRLLLQLHFEPTVSNHGVHRQSACFASTGELVIGVIQHIACQRARLRFKLTEAEYVKATVYAHLLKRDERLDSLYRSYQQGHHISPSRLSLQVHRFCLLKEVVAIACVHLQVKGIVV